MPKSELPPLPHMNGDHIKPPGGCIITAGILSVVVLGAVLFCGHRTERIREEHSRFREKCVAKGGKSYYLDLDGTQGNLVCVKGGIEDVFKRETSSE